MDKKLVGLASFGVGSLFVYAGIKGFSILKAVQNVIQGNPPQTSQKTYRLSVPGSENAPGSSDVTTEGPSGPGERAFWIAVLDGLGAPKTTANIQSLIKWRTKESPWNNQPPDGSQYTHNPLNTTLSMGGGTSINSVGVKKYPNSTVGVKATVQTLQSYTGIVSALKSGKGLCGAAPAEFQRWSGGGYSGVC